MADRSRALSVLQCAGEAGQEASSQVITLANGGLLAALLLLGWTILGGFDSKLTNEYSIAARRFDSSREELVKLSREAVKVAFRG